MRLTLTEVERAIDAKLKRNICECLAAHNRSASLRKVALICLCITEKKMRGDNRTEHRIAEEFESLVVLSRTILVTCRGVRECLRKFRLCARGDCKARGERRNRFSTSLYAAHHAAYAHARRRRLGYALKRRPTDRRISALLLDDGVDSVLDRLDLGEVFVRNLDVKLLFEPHCKFNKVE